MEKSEMEKMDEQLEIQQESLDEVGSLSFSPPPIRKSDTRDSISSVDSEISLSLDRRGSKGEEADLSDSASGSDEVDRSSSPIRRFPNSLVNSMPIEKSQETFENEREVEISLEESKEIVSTNSSEEKDTTGDEEPVVSDELAEKIAIQVEFYFSDENIVKDAFLLKHVKRNKEGYVSLKLISSFKRVKHLSRDWRVVGAALRLKSTKLQVNDLGTKLRRLNPLPQYDQTLPSRSIIAAKIPADKLTIESVAEIFRQCGEIALIRILRPGHPVPAEVRQAIAKKPELGTDDECALIEFTDSASARAAQKLNIGEIKIYELQQLSSVEKKRKQQNQNQQKDQQTQPAKKSLTNKINGTREHTYINSSSCQSGSEEESRTYRMSKINRPPNRHVFAPASNPHSHQGPPSPEVWLPRRFSACSIGSEQTSNLLLRRLSGCSNSGSSSDTGTYGSSRRFSSCSSGSENGYSSPLFHHHQPHQNSQPLYPPYNYWPNQPPRRYSCCTTSSTTTLPNVPPGYGLEYNPTVYQTGRRGSADCGSFLRRLSNCSRDSGYDGTRRLSSSSSDSCSGFRSRSNSGFVLMAHLPENVTRMPSGPDGTRGFGRKNPENRITHSSTIQSSCG